MSFMNLYTLPGLLELDNLPDARTHVAARLCAIMRNLVDDWEAAYIPR